MTDKCATIAYVFPASYSGANCWDSGYHIVFSLTLAINPSGVNDVWVMIIFSASTFNVLVQYNLSQVWQREKGQVELHVRRTAISKCCKYSWNVVFEKKNPGQSKDKKLAYGLECLRMRCFTPLPMCNFFDLVKYIVESHHYKSIK